MLWPTPLQGVQLHAVGMQVAWWHAGGARCASPNGGSGMQAAGKRHAGQRVLDLPKLLFKIQPNLVEFWVAILAGPGRFMDSACALLADVLPVSSHKSAFKIRTKIQPNSVEFWVAILAGPRRFYELLRLGANGCDLPPARCHGAQPPTIRKGFKRLRVATHT